MVTPASGGVGSVAVAYPTGSFDRRQVAASDDVQLPGLRRLTEAVHRHGATVAAQRERWRICHDRDADWTYGLPYENLDALQANSDLSVVVNPSSHSESSNESFPWYFNQSGLPVQG